MDTGRKPLFSRRGFLGAGAAGGLMAVTASALAMKATRPEQDYRAIAGDGAAPEVLSWAELAVLTVAAEVIVAPTPDMPGVRETMTARRIDRELVFAEAKLQSDLKASLSFLEVKPLLSGSLSLFTELDAARQRDVLMSMREKPVLDREIYAALKFFTGFFYYTDDRAWPSIGYGGPSVPAKKFEAGNTIANLKMT